ncbi:MAG: hypothetical protein OXT72_15250 [Gammaproteobacteria bacterium]|nr:hypothetical protein [Gammaproteobacteria bacterium]MDE0248349.1 hypothetical protein [Gammaproteobacteria bacterium]
MEVLFAMGKIEIEAPRRVGGVGRGEGLAAAPLGHLRNETDHRWP